MTVKYSSINVSGQGIYCMTHDININFGKKRGRLSGSEGEAGTAWEGNGWAGRGQAGVR